MHTHVPPEAREITRIGWKLMMPLSQNFNEIQWKNRACQHMMSRSERILLGIISVLTSAMMIPAVSSRLKKRSGWRTRVLSGCWIRFGRVLPRWCHVHRATHHLVDTVLIFRFQAGAAPQVATKPEKKVLVVKLVLISDVVDQIGVPFKWCTCQ